MLFRQKPKYLKYSKIVRIDTPANSFASCSKLVHEFHDAETKEKKLRVCSVTQYTANRVNAILDYKTLKSAERKQLEKVANNYDICAKVLWSSYGNLK